MSWSSIGAPICQGLGAVLKACPYTSAAGVAIDVSVAASQAGLAAKDAKVEKEMAKEKECKEKEAQDLQAAGDRLKVTASSFGGSASSSPSTAAPASSSGSSRPAHRTS